MAKVNDFHHVVISTGDIKKQLTFFSEVLGAELVSFFNLHGVDSGWHAFLRLSDTACISFIQVPGGEDIEPIWGVSHGSPEEGNGRSAPGTLHHFSMNVSTMEDLLNMRDRIRSHGITVIGPVNHGFCYSIYFGGPDYLNLEVSTSEGCTLHPENWVDPAVLVKAGVTQEEAERLIHPTPFEGQGGTVPQPEWDPTKPRPTGWPEEAFKMMSTLPEEQVNQLIGDAAPPVPFAGDGAPS